MKWPTGAWKSQIFLRDDDWVITPCPSQRSSRTRAPGGIETREGHGDGDKSTLRKLGGNGKSPEGQEVRSGEVGAAHDDEKTSRKRHPAGGTSRPASWDRPDPADDRVGPRGDREKFLNDLRRTGGSDVVSPRRRRAVGSVTSPPNSGRTGLRWRHIMRTSRASAPTVRDGRGRRPRKNPAQSVRRGARSA